MRFCLKNEIEKGDGEGERGGRGEKKLMHDMQGLRLSLNLAELLSCLLH